MKQVNQMTNSHILVNEFDYLEPASLDEAIALLKQYGDQAQVAAGGTNLVIWMKMEQCAPAYVVNVGKLPGLTGLSSQDEGLRVGPLTTIRALRNAPRVQADYTGLAEACAAFGSAQIQMMGTVGGNVCNGSPASDTVPALLAFDAQLTLTGPTGERNLPIADFLLGPGQTALQPGELLTGIHLPQPQPGTGSAFVKISRVAADLAKASAAAVIVRRDDEIVACRLTFGSVGPTVLRTHQAEQLLAGQTFSADLALGAGQVASEEVTPIDDVRSTAGYRRQVIRALTHDVLQLAWERANHQVQVAKVEKPGQATAPGYQKAPAETLHVARGETHEIELTVNGTRDRLAVRPNELLLNVLRERLELTGSKYGCGLGECGACTVHLDGQPALACLALAVAADGREVTTVEGLQGPDGELSPLQQAFIDHNAFQCGYCTPGMLMMTQKLLEEIPTPSEDDVRDYLKGNRCRCTGFASIVRAVLSCAE